MVCRPRGAPSRVSSASLGSVSVPALHAGGAKIDPPSLDRPTDEPTDGRDGRDGGSDPTRREFEWSVTDGRGRGRGTTRVKGGGENV